MITLPRLERLEVSGYALYPGTERNPGLTVEFRPGLTMVLGANGLGKTTLVNLVYRMLTGPYDIPNIELNNTLGGRRLNTTHLGADDTRTFANRVVDGAETAVASLVFGLGKHQVTVRRLLRNLELLALEVDGQSVGATHAEYAQDIQRMAGLSSFADWILVLRHLVFYFEDRRALVWDATAQRQLLRLLFLPPDQSVEWLRQERQILELDSLVRNLQYGLNKEESLAAKASRGLGSGPEVRQQLELLQSLQEPDQEELDELNDQLSDLTARRQRARVNALTAEQAVESARRTVERIQLDSIAAAFPNATTTGRYIIGQILSEAQCLACGSRVPEMRALVEDRLKAALCPVCGSTPSDTDTEDRPSSRALSKAGAIAAVAEEQVRAAELARRAAEDQYDRGLSRITHLNDVVAFRSAQIDELLRRLPPDEKAVHTQRSQLQGMRARLEQHKGELTAYRVEFEEFVARANVEIASRKSAIKEAFDIFAHGFLFEECELVWQPRRSRVGETGAMLEFAAFELVMSGASFGSPVRRTGPNHVSESQREFIDLSFRMALMAVASEFGGSLVIDAPESSLDAVFVKRAARVLSRFAESEADNRLLVTSNLIDGDLIPELLRLAGIASSRDGRIIDLLRIAAPTAATHAFGSEYAAVRRQIFARSRGVAQ